MPFLESGSPLRCGRNDEFSCKVNNNKVAAIEHGKEPTNGIVREHIFKINITANS